jgi:CDP-6-deoxy-D-xylo-4-hexulose-3-dehydrase
MNLEESEKLRGPLQRLIDSGSRINDLKPQRYWYPLSAATYDVEEILAAVDSLCSFRTTMWEKTREFEEHFSLRFGFSESVMVNSGSSADLVTAFAMIDPRVGGLKPGDEVLMPGLTWPTHIWSAMMAGLKVRFVDVDPTTLNIDVADLEAKITDRTRAVWLVHLMGNPCDMEAVIRLTEKHELLLAEDCCEALGAEFDGRPVGSFGMAGTFSFFFSHHITTMEGGMVSCSEAALSDTLRLLRAHGWSRNARYIEAATPDGVDPRYAFLDWGFNLRPTELQAAFGLIQLERSPGFHAARVRNADRLSALLESSGDQIQRMEVNPRAECSWFAMPLIVSSDATFTRDEIVAELEASGVETRPVVAGNLARHPVAERRPELSSVDMPGVDLVHRQGFYIGLHPFQHDYNIDRVGEVINSFIDRRNRN